MQIAKNILAQLGIGIDEAVNGVCLPRSQHIQSNASSQAAPHQALLKQTYRTPDLQLENNKRPRPVMGNFLRMMGGFFAMTESARTLFEPAFGHYGEFLPAKLVLDKGATVPRAERVPHLSFAHRKVCQGRKVGSRTPLCKCWPPPLPR